VPISHFVSHENERAHFALAKMKPTQDADGSPDQIARHAGMNAD
jgi:hypothetical protein